MRVAVYFSFITRIASTVVTEPVSPASFRDDLVRLRLFPTAARHRTRTRIAPTVTRRTRVDVALGMESQLATLATVKNDTRYRF